jgi:formylglycine-generating enzyme required for sulfatase activity
MPHIFISYAKKDTRPIAERLFVSINSIEGFSAWMDKSLEAAESWALQIQEEIDKADLLIVLLSPDVNRRVTEAQRRSFVLNEIDYAQQLNKRILPLMVRQTIMPVQIAGLEYIDFTQDEQVGWERLYGRLQKLIPLPLIAEPSKHIASLPIQESQSPVVAQKPPKRVPPNTEVKTRQGNVSLRHRISLLITLFGLVLLGGGYWAWTSGLLLSLGFLTPSPTPDLYSAEELAQSFSGTTNGEWQPYIHTFPDGIEMALVPAGCIQMGNGVYEIDGGRQCFDAFWIDHTEVTQADFERWGGAKATTNFFLGGNRPVDSITWFEARDYCENTRAARLPTEAEWEYAARGPDALLFPWGNEWNSSNVVYDGQTYEVGSFPTGVSWVGTVDMSSNVAEWTSSLTKDYPYNEADGREDRNNTTDPRVVRGGAWHDIVVADLSTTAIYPMSPEYARNFVGFRCVRNLD